MVGISDDCYVIEKSDVDLKTNTMSIKSRNVSENKNKCLYFLFCCA